MDFPTELGILTCLMILAASSGFRKSLAKPILNPKTCLTARRRFLTYYQPTLAPRMDRPGPPRAS